MGNLTITPLQWSQIAQGSLFVTVTSTISVTIRGQLTCAGNDTVVERQTIYGTWGQGDLTQTSSLTPLLPLIGGHGYDVTINWADLEPVANVYNWTALSYPIDIGISNNLNIGFFIYVGYNAPGWLWSNCTGAKCVPVVNTTGANTGQPSLYPYYMDPYYQVT